MTPAQFDCCLTNRSGASAQAARLVLVDGLSITEASAQTGLAEQSVANACVRIRKADERIRKAYLPQHSTAEC